jgi:hypothetical protein
MGTREQHCRPSVVNLGCAYMHNVTKSPKYSSLPLARSPQHTQHTCVLCCFLKQQAWLASHCICCGLVPLCTKVPAPLHTHTHIVHTHTHIVHTHTHSAHTHTHSAHTHIVHTLCTNAAQTFTIQQKYDKPPLSHLKLVNAVQTGLHANRRQAPEAHHTQLP